VQMASARPLVVGAAALSLLAAAACGSSTTVEDFCRAGDGFAKATEFDAGVKAAKRLEDTGTPDGIPEHARKGFDVVVGLVADAEDQADLEKRYSALTKSQKDTVDALDAYIAKTC
jgi:hypothetical protein